MIQVAGSVRVDLTGGTLDLWPLNVVLRDVVTLNVATGLKAQVCLEARDDDTIVIESQDYQQTKTFKLRDLQDIGKDWGPLGFVAKILATASVRQGLNLKMKSGSPPGSGLGGSSAMGATLYKALGQWQNIKRSPEEIISTVQSIEASELGAGPAGYQDYYPALYGGVLALKASYLGVEVEQLYDQAFAQEIEKHVVLINSKQQRHSGINNWEVYKGFFDRHEKMREGLEKVAIASREAYDAFRAHDIKRLVQAISHEGEVREGIFPGIMTPEMIQFKQQIRRLIEGVKICGAGGGGCFIVLCRPEKQEEVKQQALKFNFEPMEFKIAKPIDQLS